MHSHIVRLAYINGRHPFAAEATIERVPGDLSLVPTGGRLLRECREGEQVSRLVVGPQWMAVVQRRRGGSTWTMVAADDASTAAEVVAEVKSWQGPRADVKDGVVPACFTYHAGNYVERSTRCIDAPSWSSIASSYPPRARVGLDRLVAMTSETIPQGRILLLHGLPGTGKTTFLRSLASAWLPWCRLEYVLDSDVLFANSSYLFGAVLRPDDDEDDDPDEQREGVALWRMLVIEDCDELLRADAKERSGQALSRLLNLADGAVGQGQRLIMCLTTNEPIHRLHPALVRPGRCLASIQVGRFERVAAVAWLLERGIAADVARVAVGSEGSTLAELHAVLRGDAAISVAESNVLPGQYL